MQSAVTEPLATEAPVRLAGNEGLLKRNPPFPAAIREISAVIPISIPINSQGYKR